MQMRVAAVLIPVRALLLGRKLDMHLILVAIRGMLWVRQRCKQLDSCEGRSYLVPAGVGSVKVIAARWAKTGLTLVAVKLAEGGGGGTGFWRLLSQGWAGAEGGSE